MKSAPCQVVVCLLLLKEGQILLIKRSGTGCGDGHWAVPGGRVEGNESLSRACRREALEEIGIVIAPEDLRFGTAVHSAPHAENPREVALFIFMAEKWKGDVINAEPHKCSEVRFFPLSELPEGTMTSTKRFIENALNGIPFEEMFWD